MKIIKDSTDCFVVKNTNSDFDLVQIVKFLKQTNLPEKMSFEFNDTTYTFLNEDERFQFVLGIEAAWDFLDDVWLKNYERGL